MSSIKKSPKSFLKPLQEFISSNNDFQIIYSTSPQKNWVTPLTNRVCVLDSSFNPPHLGHFTLAEESLRYTYKNQLVPREERCLVLLLSVKNADKTQPQPANFEDRIEMMYLMANYLNKSLNVNVSIGLTDHAKFVDKSVSILKYIQATLPNIELNDLKLTFLVGFDTLVRIFNPKYYLPDKLLESLSIFMKTTDLFCLTRNDDKISNKEQTQYVSDISNGKLEHVPSHWSSNIHLINNTDDSADKIGLISSSSIRKEISQNNWHNQVIPEIKEYIVKEGLYEHL